MNWTEPAPDPITAHMAINYGMMSWAVGARAGVSAEDAYAALRRHITLTATISPAGVAAVMQSAYEDLMNARRDPRCAGCGLTADEAAEKRSESFSDPTCRCPDGYSRCPVHGPPRPHWPNPECVICDDEGGAS